MTKSNFPKLNKYIPITPSPKQGVFLSVDAREVLFGGSAGPGKSTSLLASALQYVEVPGYAALLLRRTYRDLALPGALMDISQQWLRGTDAHWNDMDKTWTFPSGATLTFGYLESEGDKFRYQGSELAMIGFDELTQFEESQYRYLFSRLRRKSGTDVPLRMRSASNPGGKGESWVHQLFIANGNADDRLFIPALFTDNPHLDWEAYRESLSRLDPITRAQLEEGKWGLRAEGGDYFKREWFEIVDTLPTQLRSVRFWDFAATEAREGTDPDYTVGLKMSRCMVGPNKGTLYVTDVQRFRARPHVVQLAMRQTAELDGKETLIYFEEEGGSSGKVASDLLIRNTLFGFSATPVRPTKDKVTRAKPVMSQAQAGNIKLLRGPWNSTFLDEAQSFDGLGKLHDDQIDAFAGSFSALGVMSMQPIDQFMEMNKSLAKKPDQRFPVPS